MSTGGRPPQGGPLSLRQDQVQEQVRQGPRTGPAQEEEEALMGNPRNETTPEQKEALDKLDTAIREAWVAFGRSEPTAEELEEAPESGWSKTPIGERMVGNWMVLLPVSGNDEDQLDILWPNFPPMPAWQSKGLLLDALDSMR